MFRNILLLFAFVIFLCCTFAEISSPPKVTLPHGGILVGGHMKSVSGKGIQGYRGIPYAEPPVGQLRFRAPIPVKAWSGEKIVNEDAEVCLQQDPYINNFTVVGNEDCLYMNVYTPKEQTQDELLSIMVYFHGGGWVTGSGISQLYGPDRILDNDNIILVTGNYRLGALGFLSTGTSDCPGNNGLRDQLLILKWIKDNIAAFGGNPNDVTIFGESAGGASVGYHLMSHQSKGLFHKAIMQSGTNFDRWALGDPEVISTQAAKIGKLLNCTKGEQDWKEMIECLRSKSAKEVASPLRDLYESDFIPDVTFQPVVEPNIPESFITARPGVAITDNRHIPVMIGATSDEGLITTGPLINLKNDIFKAKFSEALSIFLVYDRKPEKIRDKITAKIDQFYLNGIHDWDKQKNQNLTNIITDCMSFYGIDRFLRQRFNSSDSNITGSTYVYLYDHRGSMPQDAKYHRGPEYYGVCHTDELPYLFPFNEDVTAKSEENDEKMKWAMPFMWVNFAKTGNPTPSGSEINSWKPATKFPLNYARIGSKYSADWAVLRNEIGFFEDRLEFWRNLENDLLRDEL